MASHIGMSHSLIRFPFAINAKEAIGGKRSVPYSRAMHVPTMGGESRRWAYGNPRRERSVDGLGQRAPEGGHSDG